MEYMKFVPDPLNNNHSGEEEGPVSTFEPEVSPDSLPINKRTLTIKVRDTSARDTPTTSDNIFNQIDDNTLINGLCQGQSKIPLTQ